jgi:hypothetical protein
MGSRRPASANVARGPIGKSGGHGSATMPWAPPTTPADCRSPALSSESMTGDSDKPIPRWTMFVFSQSNPTGRGQGNVPALLRRLAESVENLGPVVVEDITFRSEPTADERDISMTVYYHDDTLEAET